MAATATGGFGAGGPGVLASPQTRRVPLTRPLDLAATLFPLWRAGHGDPSFDLTPDVAVRATRTPAGPAAARYSMTGVEVEVEAWGPGAEALLQVAPALLGQLDDDSGFAPDHPLLARLHRLHPGIRLTRSGAVLEALVPAVFEQKVVGLEARAGLRRMKQAWGEPAPGPLPLRLPPAPELLASSPYWEYHRFSLERRRAETVMRVARLAPRLEALAAGVWSADGAAPPAAATAALTAALLAIPGIGPWTAAQTTTIVLGDADAVPVGDYHLPAMVAWALAGERQADDARMLELLEPYRPHRTRVLRLLLAGHAGPPRRGPRMPLRHLERH